MSINSRPSDIKDRDLEGFRIKEMTEVYLACDGKKIESFGFFESHNIAKIFIDNHSEKIHCRTAVALVLTNGGFGYIINNDPSVYIFSDVDIENLRDGVTKKLTIEEQKFLGINNFE